MSNEFVLDLIASLQQAKSKKQLDADIRQLEKAVNMLRLTATLAKGDTKKEINNYIKELSGKLDHVKLKAKVDDKNLKREIENSLHNMSFKEIDALNIDSNKARLKLQKAVADMKAYAEKTPVFVNVNLKKEKLGNDLTAFLNKNSKLRESSVLLAESEKIRELIDSVDDKGSLRNATDAFSLFKSEIVSMGYAGKSTSQKIKDMLGHITKIGSFFGVASMAVNNFRKSLSTLRLNDTILTEISKTSEMTKRQLKELGDEAFKVASKYGQLSNSYLLGVQEMARSGYESLSKELAELSLLAQSAGDMTAENANNYLLATDAAYKYGGSVEKLNAALDGANYISNKNSASLTDIADATRVSASFAANAGVAIDELTAAEATMIAATKRSGSEMGRAFRSIILNLQQVSGEFDEEVINETQLKKVEDRCHSLGVELEYVKDGVATLRNPMEILKDLAKVYNSLPDNSAEKQGLISDLGGKYHANALSSLLSRWDLYEKMLSEFSQGTGSALEEAEKTADSWEGRLASLQNSWDSFVNTLTNKEAIKGGISFFDRLIQGAETLTNAIGEIPVALTALNSALVMTNKDYGITQIWDKDKRKIDLQGNIFGIDITNIKNMKKHFAEAEGAIQIWNDKLINGKANLDKFKNSVVQNNAQLKEYLSTCSKDARGSLEGYKSYLKAAGVSTDALRLKTLLLNSAITMLGGWAIQAIMEAFYELSQVSGKVADKAQELGKAFSDTKSDIDSYKLKIEDLYKTINDSGSSIGDVTEARKNLMAIQDELIGKFGNEEEAIDIVTDAVNGQADAFDRLTDRQWQEAKNQFDNAGFWGGIGNWLGGYESNIDRMADEMENAREILSFSRKDFDSNEFNELAKQMKRLGWTYRETLGGFVKEGSLKGIYSDILEIQGLVKYMDAPDKFIKELTQDANKAKKTLDSYSGFWDTYVLREMILQNEELAQSWEDVNETYAEYRKAFENGDKDAQNNAVAEFAQSLNNVLDDSDVRESVKEYFRDMYPAMTREAEKWEFRFKILPEYDIHALNGKTQAEILEMLQTDGFQYGEQTFNSLLSLAGDYGIIIGDDSEKIRQLLGLLVEWGILQGNIAEPPEIDGSEIEALAQKLTSSQESLDKFQSSIKSAADAYEKLMAGSYSSSELLGSIQTITKAATEMGESIKWEEIGSLDELGDKIEEISNTYADSVLSGSGLKNSGFGQMLASIVQEAYESEAALSSLNKQIDSMQDSYKSLTDIIDAYNEHGYITFDQLQALLSMEPQYLNCLMDENGQLQLNQEAMQALAEQRLKDARAQIIAQAITELNELQFKKEKAAVDDAKLALEDIGDTITSYEEKLLGFIPVAELTTEEFIKLSNAMNGAASNGVSDEDIDMVAQNMEKKFKLARDMLNGDIGNMFGGFPSSKDKDATKEFDWIEQAIENVKKEVKSLDEIANSSYATFSQKNAALAKEIGKVSEEIGLQQQAYEEYMRKADSIGLSDHYKALIQNGSIGIENIPDEKLQEKIDAYQKWHDKAQGAADAIKELNTDLKDLHVSAYELNTAELKDRLDNDSITEKQYLQELEAAYKRHYEGLEEYAQQYHEAVLDHLKQEKDYLNSVAGAAVSLLDTEINSIRDSAEEQEEQLKRQIELREDRKKPLQDELDALEEKARKEDQILNLQKAQYDLAKAENQNTKLVYSEGRGLHYTNDTKAARDAQKSVDDAKLEIQKQFIQDQINILDDEITKYDELIDQVNKAADAQVKALEKVKNKWQEVTDQQNYGKNVAILTGEFGADAIEKILSGNDDGLLEKWKDSYINVLSAIDMETQGHIGEITRQLEALYRNAPNAAAVYANAVTASPGSGNPAGVPEGAIVTANGKVLMPLQPGDRMYGMVQKFNVYLDGINHNVEKLVPNSFYERNAKLNEVSSQVTNSSIVNNIANNRNMQPVINGGLNITCPGITSQEVARQVGIKVNDMFNGLHLEADQRSRIR